ncbi:Aspartyl/glutamyl-tRNA(Asn/Gln) amidotransferase subunit B [Gemmatirosa kalamazoonensis]|uniref:Aspartyl/glutamyl-tRNA(Asn/Gln) amidotransferase subunit B n=1 Tax=Gemmatirosa kalamazoonensis TaxID=861299 RepID=W0RJW9_9BACT|nr:Asp-tRNA(Asn)/Glu-tRNA(Gln) amidotransferase subunit GatB [Gemmatirosa kalamazoonensis]AHG90717.1 Aspartyl/glutamyl-tRNA(Asn/Gln) amidotransferase subunit B [Gemmatirosa kalamazoonensis]
MTATAPSRSASWAETYEMVVGLEVHVQLATRTKIFCNCSTNFGAEPNANTCPVCLGLPGTLPVLNYEAVVLATRAALALGCDVHEISVFARKNYFYPDLPKGYQITQYDRPLATGGKVQIGETPDGAPLNVGVHRVHMEEDAGKSLHDRFPGGTAIDLNRTGVPLIEIVSEPDMRSSAEAGAYLRSLKQIIEYVGASDANMEEGSLRVDANISVRRRGDTGLGTKTEIKNMNSFAGVERALEAEFVRQCALIASGGAVEQQTMLWDDKRGETRPARSKEGSHDYRYFPEPDLPPLILTREWIEARRDELPELPAAHRERLKEAYGLGPAEVGVLAADRGVSTYFESVARIHGDAKTAAHWVMRDVLKVLNETGHTIEEFQLQVRPADLAALLDMIRDDVVSHSAGAQIFVLMVRTGVEPQKIAEREGLLKVTDDAKLRAWVDEVFAEHPAEAERFAGGDRKLQGPLVGFVMKKSGGSADPKRVNALLAERVR